MSYIILHIMLFLILCIILFVITESLGFVCMEVCVCLSYDLLVINQIRMHSLLGSKASVLFALRYASVYYNKIK